MQEQIVRWQNGAPPQSGPDELALEEPLELRVDNHPISVTLRTPGHDHELAAGFLISEGLLRRRGEIFDVRQHPRNTADNVINVFLAPEVVVDFKRLTRHVFASSSCGLCGKATIEAIHQQFPPIESDLRVEAATIVSLPGRLGQAQTAFKRTGGLHAAAVFDAQGGLVVLREDVGRHNAVDKVLGFALLNGVWPLDRHILMVSGRASFEIVQKALAARVPVVAAISAPSSLAVQFARESGQTLIGFLRDQRMNLYSESERVIQFKIQNE